MSMICGNISRNEGKYKENKISNGCINIHNFYKTNINISTDMGRCETLIHNGVKYYCVLCGEVYNKNELLSLIKKESNFDIDVNMSETLLLIWMYIFYGTYSPKYIDGKFAYVIYSEVPTSKMFLAVDRFGFRTIYYREDKGIFYFSNSFENMMKAGKNTLSCNGLGDIFYLDGNTFDNYTVIDEIKMIPSGECAYIDCRDKINMIRKSYVNYNKNTDNAYSKREEFAEKIYNKNPLTDVMDCINIPDTLDIYKAFSNYTGEKNIYSNIGAVLFNISSLGSICGFFPWINDPYESISILDTDKIDMIKSFDNINKRRQKYARPDGKTYFLDSAVKLYLPMKIRKLEIISEHFNINIKYPLCNIDLIGKIYKLENHNAGKLQARNYENKDRKYINSIYKKLIDLTKDESSIVSYITNEEKIKENMGNIKALNKLYMTHIFVRKYSLDFNI